MCVVVTIAVVGTYKTTAAYYYLKQDLLSLHSFSVVVESRMNSLRVCLQICWHEL